MRSVFCHLWTKLNLKEKEKIAIDVRVQFLIRTKFHCLIFRFVAESVMLYFNYWFKCIRTTRRLGDEGLRQAGRQVGFNERAYVKQCPSAIKSNSQRRNRVFISVSLCFNMYVCSCCVFIICSACVNRRTDISHACVVSV